MPGRVSSLHESRFGTGTDYRYVPLGSGLIWDLLGRLHVACRLLFLVSVPGNLLVVIMGTFMTGCPLTTAAAHSCEVDPGRWLTPHLAISAYFGCQSWTFRVTQPVQRTPLWHVVWLAVLSLLRYTRCGRFMMIDFSFWLCLLYCVLMSLSAGGRRF